MPTRADAFGVLAFLNWNHDWNKWHFDDALLVRAVAQLQSLGLKSVRTDILWADVDRGYKQYDFARYDRVLSLLADHGLEPLVLLHYNKHHMRDGREVWNEPPASFEEFAAFVEAAVRHFRDRVRHWEIWNEPNHPVYWAPPQDGLVTYAKLLRLAYAAAKTADPGAIVLNGGITEPLLADVENFYRNGGKTMTDALSIHTFVDPLALDAEDRFRALLRGVTDIQGRHGDAGRPIWITEMGCPGIPAGAPLRPWFGGAPVTEAQQADWLETQYRLIGEWPSVQKLFWAFYRDTDGLFPDATDHLGLVRFDLSPKPAFFRMKSLVERAQRATGAAA